MFPSTSPPLTTGQPGPRTVIATGTPRTGTPIGPASRPHDLKPYVGETDTVLQPSRLRRLASNIGRFFGAPAPTVEQRPPVAPEWRPANPAFQHFHELIDGIGKAPDGQRPAIAHAMTARLVACGMTLPPCRHTPGHTVCTLLSPTWFKALEEQRLNIGELLGALRRSDEVDPALRPELRRRLMTAFEVVIHRLAETDTGIRSLRERCAAPLRPMPATPPRPGEPGPRMRGFRNAVASMVRELPASAATPGCLAAHLFKCLRHSGNISRDEEKTLSGQIAPAVEALIHADAAARQFAEPLRAAADRIENYLQITACLDMAAPDQETPGQIGLSGMSPRQARGFLLSRLLISALDPAVLDDQLKRGAINEWMHPTLLAYPRNRENSEKALVVLRQTLRPLLETGLIDRDQGRTLMQHARRHLHPTTEAAAI